MRRAVPLEVYVLLACAAVLLRQGVTASALPPLPIGPFMAATWYFAFGVLTLVSAALLYLVRVSERALDELHTLAQRHKAPHAEAHRV